MNIHKHTRTKQHFQRSLVQSRF